MKRGLLNCAVFAWSVCGFGCALDPEVGVVSAAIVGPSELSGDGRVVAILAGGEVHCSGTVVGERAVLTAAHCAALMLPGDLMVADAPMSALGSMAVSVRGIAVHPEYLPGDASADLAILELSERWPAGGIANIHLGQSPREVSGEVRVVGFGVSDEGQSGARREGWAQVVGVDEGILHLERSPAQTCFGDSGGPVFATHGDDEELVAVTSRGDGACQEWASATRTDTRRDFIVSTLAVINEAHLPSRGANGDGCEADRDCVEGICAAGACRSRCLSSSTACQDGFSCEDVASESGWRACVALPARAPEDAILEGTVSCQAVSGSRVSGFAQVVGMIAVIAWVGIRRRFLVPS